MNIFRNTSKFNVVALVAFIFVSILHVVVELHYGSVPKGVYELSFAVGLLVCIRIFMDNYKEASRERFLKIHEAEEEVCRKRRQMGACPLIGLEKVGGDCCHRKHEDCLNCADACRAPFCPLRSIKNK